MLILDVFTGEEIMMHILIQLNIMRWNMRNLEVGKSMKATSV